MLIFKHRRTKQINHFLLDTEMNTIEIIINKNKLKKPPLCSIIANFYRVCLPQDAIISPNEGSNFSLQFKIKITQFFLYQIVPNPLFSRQILNFEMLKHTKNPNISNRQWNFRQAADTLHTKYQKKHKL